MRSALCWQHAGALEGRLRYYLGENATHRWWTMTLTNTTAKDTGYYSCESNDLIDEIYIKLTRKKYVYFFSSYNFQ